MGGRVEGNRAAGSRLVLDDDLLAPDFRQAAGDDATGQIHPSARGKTHHEADDAVWPSLSPRGSW